jgi:hypothetical protein
MESWYHSTLLSLLQHPACCIPSRPTATPSCFYKISQGGIAKAQRPNGLVSVKLMSWITGLDHARFGFHSPHQPQTGSSLVFTNSRIDHVIAKFLDGGMAAMPHWDPTMANGVPIERLALAAWDGTVARVRGTLNHYFKAKNALCMSYANYKHIVYHRNAERVSFGRGVANRL